MRVLLLTGKGGVGTTTIAAAHAVHAARHGLRTLVLAIGSGHGLAGALARPLPSDVPTEIEPGLSALRAGRPALGRHLAGGRWDLVVVDGAPAERTLGLLATPDEPDLAVLRSPDASVRLVLTPEAASLAEARRALTALTLQGLAVDGVLVNRVVPAPPRQSGWQASKVRSQRLVLDGVRESFVGLPVACTADRVDDPVGPAALADLGRDLLGSGTEALAAGPDRPRSARVERVGPDFLLVLELPLVPGRDVDLSRHGDRLLVAAAGTRRFVPLPSVLRRCTVVGARVRSGALHVRFMPDPAHWPARLLPPGAVPQQAQAATSGRTA
jgi:arsenite/tail-anchored protein-transporting ATPase